MRYKRKKVEAISFFKYPNPHVVVKLIILIVGIRGELQSIGVI